MNIYQVSEHTAEPVVRDGRSKFIAVFLSSDISDQLQNFRCLSCGWVVFQYTNKNVEALVYGSATPREENHHDIMCSRCKLIFRIV